MVKVTKEELAGIKAYTDFMYNPANEYNCMECPENVGEYSKRYPCGQQNCWITCHCRIDRDKERYL